ncbi:hypothetical protein HPB52_005760 [Rhipicephalus sanguineus]|uniref:Uncharacterized protein n=1 Tax=Rhipicephalus sanguineus TaxID=34632 RepID=A0A9D4PUJ7_RHISA|nr:hypothetical protein HPB52_005760 [Rhipicephalus sanguineus]
MADAHCAQSREYGVCDTGNAVAFPRHLHMPCTKVGDSDCQLLLYLRSTKELLLGASLELVEDQRRPGGLRLAVVQAPASPCPLPCSLDKRRKEVALHYAEHLLSEHSTEQPRSLLAALGRNLAVKSVTVRLELDHIYDPNVHVLEVVNELSHLEELKFASVSCNMQSRCEDATHLKGPLMERRMEHLRSLDVSVLTLRSESVRRLVWALIWNHTITELAVPECVFCAFFHDNGELFARYLKKKDATLRKLTLKSLGVFKDPENALTALAEAFWRIEPFARVVAQNTTLRSLGLPSAACRRCRSSTAGFLVVDPAEGEIDPWLTALRKTSSLQNLRIDFRTFGQEAFPAFLDGVAKSDNLRSVVLTHPPTSAEPEDICRAIRVRGLGNRVRIADYHAQWWGMHRFGQCFDITRVTVDVTHFTLGFTTISISSNMKSAFGLFRNVKSLRVSCAHFQEEHIAALCAYLSAPSALEDVELTWCTLTLDMTAEESRRVPSRLSSALASNVNLCSVIIKGLQLGNEDLDALADAAARAGASPSFGTCRGLSPPRTATIGGSLDVEEPPFRLDSHASAALVEYSLDKFMRTAGVVFQSVECHPQHDGSLQLPDIGEDCWSLICRYLSLADVVKTA